MLRLDSKLVSISASRVANLLMHHLADRQMICCPNCYYTGYEADVLAVSNTNHKLIDLEIKLYRSDLKADINKDKWNKRVGRKLELREHAPNIWKHYYVMPSKIWDETLLDCIPKTSGILLLLEYDMRSFYRYRLLRRPICNKDAKALTNSQILDIARLANMRYLREMTKMNNDRFIGRFKVARHYITTYDGVGDKTLEAVFSEMVPINIDFDAATDEFIYTCISRHFRRVKYGDKIPFYKCQYDAETNTINFIEYQETESLKDETIKIDNSINIGI